MQLAITPQADQRSAEILASVRHAFVAKGFDGASMQDLARAAGMSVGNFYRYFPSKAAIIQALIALDRAEVQRDFQTIILSEQPMQSLRHLVHTHINCAVDEKDGDLWVEIEAASRRSPDICAAAQQMEIAVTDCLVGVFAAELGLSHADATQRFATTASFIFAMFKSSACLNCAPNVDQTQLKSMIIRTIDQTLDDVTNSARKA
jgi:AcrR family transcriptional regulator